MIPLSTTTIRVERVPTVDDGGDPVDPYDPQPDAEIVAEAVRAVISSPTGRERNIGGTQSAVEFSLSCDPVDLRHTDTVHDEATGLTYQVVWVTSRPSGGLGLDHTRAGLKMVSGIA